MKTTMVIVGLAVLAATMTVQAPTAEAGFRGPKFRFIGVRLAPRFHRPRHVYRVYRKPVYTERYRAVTPRAAVVAYADGLGREYDPATRVWFDGDSNCWTGREAWTFKRGMWFYGGSRWREVDGVWQTDADVEPVAIDCKASPRFAARRGTGDERKVSSRPNNGFADGSKTQTVPPVPPARTAETQPSGGAPTAPVDRAPGKSQECSRYFPEFGRVMPAPCG